MKEQTKVDWSKAPEGATHYSPSSFYSRWYKLDGGNYFYYSQSTREWLLSGNSPEFVKTYIPRSVETKPSPEWKIKHIKADDYKCGRDVALTVLYKDIGDGYYEYKYAVCNTTDMFSRKKGVEAALDKPDTWKVYIGNYKTKGALQIIVWHLPFTRKMSREVVNLLLDEGFYGS
jgi:hypothetical protein